MGKLLKDVPGSPEPLLKYTLQVHYKRAARNTSWNF